MNVSANKIELVANNFVDQDLDLDSIKQLYKDVYIKGFKRGVERCDASVPREAWIDIDTDHGIPYSCTCGRCGYISITGESNYCPECGALMGLKFKSYEAAKFYEAMAHKRFSKIRSED